MKVASTQWTPHIGDPTLAGWLCVALYAVAVFVCVRAARRACAVGKGCDLGVAWRVIAAFLLLLGLNKQLDLQAWVLSWTREQLGPQSWRGLAGFLGALFAAGLAWGCFRFRNVIRVDTGMRLAVLGVVALQAVIVYRWTGLPGAGLLMRHILSVDRGVYHTHVKEVLEIGAIGIVVIGALSIPGLRCSAIQKATGPVSGTKKTLPHQCGALRIVDKG